MCAGVSPAAEAGLVGARHVRVAARLLPECDDPFRVRAPRDPLDRSTQCPCRIKLSALWVPGVCKGSIAFVSRENLRAPGCQSGCDLLIGGCNDCFSCLTAEVVG